MPGEERSFERKLRRFAIGSTQHLPQTETLPYHVLADKSDDVALFSSPLDRKDHYDRHHYSIH